MINLVNTLFLLGVLSTLFNAVVCFLGNPKPAVVALPFTLFMGAA